MVSQVIKRSEWEVDSVPLETAREMVSRYHYARGGSNTRVYTHGLFKRGDWLAPQCYGVAWWIPPTKAAAEATCKNWQGVLSLSRLAIHPAAPKNAASFLIGASVRMIDRERWPCLVTYADEWQGHTGQIYKATNWTEAGRTKPEATYTLHGQMVSRKSGPRTLTHAQMLELGAVCVGRFSRIKFVKNEGE